jgi:hypothetical protein
MNFDIKLKSYFYIYLGTIFYTLASYYHLSFKEWSLKRAFTLALPFVSIEYFFSLQGNKYLHDYAGKNSIEILLITMCFYFVNNWLLNYFVIKNEIIIWKELASFMLIIGAFLLSSNIKVDPHPQNKLK